MLTSHDGNPTGIVDEDDIYLPKETLLCVTVTAACTLREGDWEGCGIVVGRW